MTLEEIGEKFDLTRERVIQIKEKAVRSLIQTSSSKILNSYLGLIERVLFALFFINIFAKNILHVT